MKISFRCDGSTQIGMGHVVRSLTLAGSLRKSLNADIIFVSKGYPEGVELISRNGFTIKTLPTDLNPDEEKRLVTAYITDNNIKNIITDSYSIDESYQRALQKAGKFLITIDDTASFNFYFSDIIINGNIYASELKYQCNPQTKLLLGIKYFLLRDELKLQQRRQRNIKDSIETILVVFGGSDPENYTQRMVNILEIFEMDVKVKVIAGPGYAFWKDLQKQAGKSDRNIEIFRDPPDMATIISGADIAISGAGITAYELAYRGVPSIVMPLAENQQPIADSLAGEGAVINLGEMEKVTDSAIAETVQSLAHDREQRKRMSRKGKALIDGEGVERVVTEIRGLIYGN